MNLLSYLKKYKNAYGLFLATIASSALSILLSITLARVLTVEDRGALQFILTNIIVISTISVGGVGYALGIGIKNNEYKGWAKFILGYIAITFPITFIFHLFITGISQYSNTLMFCVALYSLTLITIEKSNIDQQLTAYKFLTILQPCINLMLFSFGHLTLGTVHLKTGLTYLNLSYVILSIFSLLFLINLGKKYKAIKNKIQLSSFYKIWIKQYLFQCFGVLTINLDKYLITFFLGDYILGIYSVYLALDGLIGKFFQSAANYHYSNIWNKLDKTKPLLTNLIIICLIILISIQLFGSHAVNFLFGPKYSEINDVLIFLAISSMISGFSWILSQNMIIIGKQIPLIIRQLSSIIIFSISIYIFKEYNLFGIAISLMIASTTRLFFSVYYLYRYPIKLGADVD